MINYIKNIIKVIIWPILFSIGQFLIIMIFGLIFNINKLNIIKNSNPDLNSEGINNLFNELVKTDEYKVSLAQFISDNTIWIVLLTVLIFIPILIKKYKKFNIKVKEKLNKKNIFLLILLGISLSICLNFIIININKIIHITNAYDKNLINKNIILNIISTSILGPILEEYLFRGIVYNKLKEFNKIKTSIILSTLIFSLSHTGIQIIYAFILGLILTIIYEKTNNLKYNILLHISANTTTILIVNNLIELNIYLSISLIIVTFISSILLIKNIFK